MSLLAKGGITRLSELTIDADKDWQAFGITNLEQVAAAMARGDLVVRNNLILERLQPGPIGLVLTSAGPLHIPTWQPAGGALKYYFPAQIEVTDSEVIVAADKFYNKNAPITSPHAENYLDDVAHNIKRLDSSVALVDAEAIAVVNRTDNENVPITRQWGLKMLVDGAIKEDTPALVDDTANARSGGANDMVLLPALPIVNDAYYIGFNYPFDIVWLNIGTAGDGNWALTEEYWNGFAWTALAGVVDGTNQFLLAGLHSTSFTKPGDWALTNPGGIGNLYWMRYRVSAFVNINIQPLGTQAWCEKLS